MEKVIALGCDHAGFDYKEAVIKLLKERGYTINDKGTNSQDSVDYPDFVHPVANDIEAGKAECGIVMCGSGNGVAITVNKHAGIRAALCWTEELAELARQHNNANVLAIPVRFVSEPIALDMVRAFLDTEFEGGRHQRRVDKIDLK
ncbi:MULTISPECIES: ribose 5-phosphate isomerase B [unclassified Aureispira]|uniref:ribose 5-phosphate isomerase B n=1 Tax=unclassified Aureispira TaxID=2649989 RepID=UPI000698F303|nr:MULTISPECIES: ribose 5-phosphate isomerase B [unclassified Aureispira]WMX14527.1 ribose 5-phosphate isomerase B [Aureispira sp. CCB-E]